MNCHFRSHLMQQFAASARTQSRPPLALFSIGSEHAKHTKSSSTGSPTAEHRRTVSSSLSGSTHTSPISPIQISPFLYQSFPSSALQNSSEEVDFISEKQANINLDDGTAQDAHQHPSPSARQFQQVISSRRTVSNFLPSQIRPHLSPDESSISDRHDSTKVSSANDQRPFLRNAIQRGVECAMSAPNHKNMEPTTFHQILAPSNAAERLLDIAYGVTLQRLRAHKLSGEEACRSEAMRKKEKWSNIPAFVVATISGMQDQCPATYDREETVELYKELPYVAPSTMRQLEDYASACASIQNLLLSLHSEGLGSKWATGPVIRTRAFRNLIGCQKDDMVVGLIMVGLPKRLPRMPRRRRGLKGDLVRDVEL